MKNLFKNIILISLSISVANAIEDTNKIDDYLSRTSANISFGLKKTDSNDVFSSIRTVQPLYSNSSDDVIYGTASISSASPKYNIGTGYRKIFDDAIYGINIDAGRGFIDNSYSTGDEYSNGVSVEFIKSNFDVSIGANNFKSDIEYKGNDNKQNIKSDGKHISLSYHMPKNTKIKLNTGYYTSDTKDIYYSFFSNTYRIENYEAKTYHIGASYKISSSVEAGVSFAKHKYSGEYDLLDTSSTRLRASLSISLGARSKSAQNLYHSDDLRDILLR